jgi:hypothetical protein
MRWFSLANLLIPLLAVVAEGAWLTVVYLAVQAAVAGQPPVLGIVELPLSVAIGMLLVRLRIVDPEERPFRFLPVVVAIGIAGWLIADPARHALVEGDLVAAVGQHPGGWLLLVGFLRGAGRPDPDDRGLTRLLLRGIPFLAVPWLLGGLAAPELRAPFIEGAYIASLTFVSAGFMAAGLARLQEIGRETGVDWRRNRTWLALIAAVIAVVILLALPMALLLDLPATTVLLGILGPLSVVAAAVLYLIAYPFTLAAGVVFELLRSLGVQPAAPDAQPGSPLRDGLFADPTLVELWYVLLGLTWALLALTAFTIARYWRSRRAGRRVRDEDEERSIVLPRSVLRPRLPALRLPRRRRGSVRAEDAVTAYLATLDALHRADEGMARFANETPAAHARRLRAGGDGGLTLDLLAADYQLARYAERRLSPAEHRRALSRWRRIRDGLRRR